MTGDSEFQAVLDDLSEVDLAHYRKLEPRWRDWEAAVRATRQLAAEVLDLLTEEAE